MKKKIWARGRKSICPDNDKSETINFQICPNVMNALQEYCKANRKLKSVVINQAILEYTTPEEQE